MRCPSLTMLKLSSTSVSNSIGTSALALCSTLFIDNRQRSFTLSSRSFTSYRPLSNSESEMMSLTIVISSSELWRMVFAKSFFSFSSKSMPGVSISCENPTIAFSGVRISWLMFCMNTLFNLSDCSACALAVSSSSFFFVSR